MNYLFRLAELAPLRRRWCNHWERPGIQTMHILLAKPAKQESLTANRPGEPDGNSAKRED